jgi:putative FmdB family regulatory protein
MPTYDYECNACGHAFEEFQSIKAEPIRKCPQCGKKKVRRLIGIGAGVIFKGSGFYQTDYRSDSYKAGAAKDKADRAGTSTSTASTSTGTGTGDKGGAGTGDKGGAGASEKKPAAEGAAKSTASKKED